MTSSYLEAGLGRQCEERTIESWVGTVRVMNKVRGRWNNKQTPDC